MKTPYKLFLLISSTVLLLVLPKSTGFSCGPDIGVDASMFLLFQQNLAGNRELEPFYYTQEFLHGNAGTFLTFDNHKNCAEWQAITGKRVKEQDIFNIQYNTSPDRFLYSHATGQWAELADNTFIQWLQIHKLEADYFAFAKKVEFAGGCETDPWNNPSERQWGVEFVSGFDKPLYDSLIVIAMAGCKNHKGFLKDRYAYQAVKLMYYRRYNSKGADTMRDKSQPQLVSYYEAYLKDRPTVVSNWGMLFYALSLKNKALQTFYLVKAFDQTTEQKALIFRYIDKVELMKLGRITSDKHMLAAIAAMKGLYSPGRALAQIKETYAQEPDSKYIPLLVTREINKLEDWIWSQEMQGFSSVVRTGYDSVYNKDFGWDADYTKTNDNIWKNKIKDEQYLAELRQYLISMTNGRHQNTDFLKLSIAHLYHLEHNFAGAAPYINSIQVDDESPYAVQVSIEKALGVIYSEDITKDDTKQKIDNIFLHMGKLGLSDTIASARFWDEGSLSSSRDVLRQLYLLLSHEYKKKGDIVTAGLLFHKCARVINEYFGNTYDDCQNIDTASQGDYADGSYYGRIAYFEKFGGPKDIDALLSFRHKKRYTAFERRILPCRWPSDDVYLDVKGTLLLRQENYKEALAVFNKIRPDFWSSTYEYIHYLHKNSVTGVGTLLPTASGTAKKYTQESKRDIVQEIVALQDSLSRTANNSVKADLCFLLANSYLNISYYGKDWMVYNYGKTAREQEGNHDFAYFSFRTANKQQYRNYYHCDRAMEMYKQAYRLSANNAELGAQCLLMLSYCDDAVHAYTNDLQPNERRNDKPYYSSYIGILRKHFSHTQMFDRSSTECPDIMMYSQKSR